MDTIMACLSALLKIFLIYSAAVSLFCLLPRREFKISPAKTRFAVLIAARNEASVIGHTVETILQSNYPKELFDVFVVPNNCTDDTEGAALRAGAKILPCTAPVHNKGDALRQAFAALAGSPYDAFCVFDADNLVDPDFLPRMNDAFCAGYRVAKGRLKAANPGQTWVAGCYDIYFENFDLMYNRPRSVIGLSSKLVGTGFAVSASLLKEMGGWNTVTIAEDAEFAALCAQRNERVAWVPKAISYDEEPLSLRQSIVQRKRWCSGVQEVGRRMIPSLWGNFLKSGNLRAMDFAMFLSMPFVQVIMLIPALWNLIPVFASSGWPMQLLISFVGFWVGSTALAFGLAIAGRRSIKVLWKAILLYPVYTATWLPLQLLAVFHRTTTWKPMVHGKFSRTPACPR